MPCYEVRTMSVEFQAKHKDVLEEALKKLPHQVYVDSAGRIHINYDEVIIDVEKGKAEVREGSGQRRLNELKRTYSEAALEKVAKANMWQKKKSKQNTRKGVLRKF